MKAIKLLFFSLMCLTAMNLNAQSYVDLGLSSGTKWKSANEKGFYSYGEAISTFGNSVPSQEQWMELRNECDWTWSGMGYKVVGPNGNSIVLPAAGSRYNSRLIGAGSRGDYWSSSLHTGNPYYAWELYFSSDSCRMYDDNRYYGQSVRPVRSSAQK